MSLPRSIATTTASIVISLGAQQYARAASELEPHAVKVSAAFDKELLPIIEKWKVTGVSIAVAKDGKIALAKGYGSSDLARPASMSNSTLFRMGSINKTLTAAAVMKLVERGKVRLDEPALPILDRLGVLPERVQDSRAPAITVRHLLQHTAGFDRDASGDPFFQPRLFDVSNRQKVAPVTCEAIVRYTLSQPLDFSPGSRYAYSNIGYCMLGLIVREVSGEDYQTFVSREFLVPSTGRPYLSGDSKRSLPNESNYYMPPGSSRERAAPGVDGFFGVPAPYGSYSLESMEALGAWVATPLDALKFFLALDGARGAALLEPESIAQMLAPAPHDLTQGQAPARYYGLGLEIRRTPRGMNWWHTGVQPGLQTLALRTAEGYSWVFAINTSPANSGRREFFSDFDQAMWRAARSVNSWPQRDATE